MLIENLRTHFSKDGTPDQSITAVN